jgi:hypothetical protein
MPTMEKTSGRKFPGAARKPAPVKPPEIKEVPENVVYQSPKGPEFDLVRVIEIKPEPLFGVVCSKLKDLCLKVFAISDYIKFDMSATEIEFAATMMFEKRIVNATVTNTSQIRFDYQWVSSKFISIKTEYCFVRPCPFSVQPSAGFIEPGQATTFQVQFAPEEVDDFSAELVCSIPHITKGTSPPTIAV